MTTTNMMRVNLYAVLVDAIDDVRTFADCRSLLSAEELARQERFIFERNRREFVYAHALVRLALSRHAQDVAPDEWQFSVGVHGRPAIVGPKKAPEVHFNLSHTSGLVACVVADSPLIGVDVESVDRADSTMEIAERFFAPSDLELLRRVPLGARREWFLRLWTLKESYIKARALGLALPLDQFWFVFRSRSRIEIEFGPGVIDTPSRWCFGERQPTPKHFLAVAVGAAQSGHWILDLVEDAIHIGRPDGPLERTPVR